MNELTTILEKISTFNINANTNLDIQAIVEKYMMYRAVQAIVVALIVGIMITIIAFIIRGLVKKHLAQYDNEAKEAKVKEFVRQISNWDNVRDVKEMLNEILEYMPRNKRKRQTNHDS